MKDNDPTPGTTYYLSIRAFLVERYCEAFVACAHVPRALEHCAVDMFMNDEHGPDCDMVRQALTRLRTRGHLG